MKSVTGLSEILDKFAFKFSKAAAASIRRPRPPPPPLYSLANPPKRRDWNSITLRKPSY